jgi:bifunctional DNase/RNase
MPEDHPDAEAAPRPVEEVAGAELASSAPAAAGPKDAEPVVLEEPLAPGEPAVLAGPLAPGGLLAPGEAAPEEPRAYGPLVELVVTEVLAAVPLRPGQEAGLAVLAERYEPFRSLQIYIGQPEARAIQAGQRGDRPPRPSTWDLFLSVVEALGAKLVRAVIDGVEEARHFYASLELNREDEVIQLRCRPSDAIALAVRVPGAGLYATEDVLEAAGRYPELY